MKKFLLAYTSPISVEEQMQKSSSQDMQKSMAFWNEWFAKYKDAIVEMGAPLGKGESVFKGGNSKPQPHVSGYTIVQAENMDAVKEMIANHPHFRQEDTGIDVFEILPAPGM